MTTSEMMTTATATAQAGTNVRVAARVFIRATSVRDARPACQIRARSAPLRTSVADALYLHDPTMQPKVSRLMAVRATSNLKLFVKFFGFVARSHTR